MPFRRNWLLPARIPHYYTRGRDGFPGWRWEKPRPNLRYELDRFAARTGQRVTLSREAQERFLTFATSTEALWTANFRDLSGAVTRMATLAPGGRITEAIVSEEIERLRAAWRRTPVSGSDDTIVAEVLGEERAAQLDLFDRVQLAEVLRVCRAAPSLSEGGRRLFAVSRNKKRTSNDADRVRKYLARFGVEHRELKMMNNE
jgi:transcriptional regulatory protein RtcR